MFLKIVISFVNGTPHITYYRVQTLYCIAYILGIIL